MRLWVDDGTGTMFIQAYDSEADVLIDRTLSNPDSSNRIPGTGENVDIVGKLRLQPGFKRMILEVAGGTHIIPKKLASENMTEIVSNPENYLYKRVKVSDKKVIWKEKHEEYGFATVTLQDVVTGSTMELFITYSAPWFEEWFSGFWNELSKGDTITATGGVGLYGGTVQLYPANPSEVVVSD